MTSFFFLFFISSKSLQAKQANLLSRLDELDQDCAGLREELGQMEGSRQKLQNEVKNIQTHCNELQHRLEAEQVMQHGTDCCVEQAP